MLRIESEHEDAKTTPEVANISYQDSVTESEWCYCWGTDL